MEKIQHKVWVEKYRPTKLSGIILPSALRTYFENMIKSGFVSNMTLFSSSGGTGKSSLMRVLCNELNIEDYLYINVSKDGSIDIVRDTITKFVTTCSISGNQKIVLLDEIESAGGGGTAFQNSLRAFIEHFSSNAAFVLATNNPSRIIPQLLSRCPVVDFSMTSKESKSEIAPLMFRRLCGILKNEKVQFEEPTVVKLVEKYYPDMRSMIGALQRISLSTGIVNDEVLKESTDLTTFYDLLLQKKVMDCRKFLIEGGFEYANMYSYLFRDFVPMIKDGNAQNEVIILIGKYMFYHSSSVDPEVTFTALMCELIKRI